MGRYLVFDQVVKVDVFRQIWGTTVYMAVLGTVLGKAALISELVIGRKACPQSDTCL